MGKYLLKMYILGHVTCIKQKSFLEKYYSKVQEQNEIIYDVKLQLLTSTNSLSPLKVAAFNLMTEI